MYYLYLYFNIDYFFQVRKKIFTIQNVRFLLTFNEKNKIPIAHKFKSFQNKYASIR